MITCFILCLYIKDWNEVYNQMSTDKLTLSHIGRAREVFHGSFIFFSCDMPQVAR